MSIENPISIMPEAAPAPPVPPDPIKHPTPVPAVEVVPQTPTPVVSVPVEEDLTIGNVFTVGWQRFLKIKLTTHMFAGIAGFLGVMWASDATFRAQIAQTVDSMPHWMQGVITMGTMVYATYKTTHAKTKVG